MATPIKNKNEVGCSWAVVENCRYKKRGSETSSYLYWLRGKDLTSLCSTARALIRYAHRRSAARLSFVVNRLFRRFNSLQHI